jgi:putative nucleotidyltransferase with HDIG domain
VTKVLEVCSHPSVSAYDLNRVISLDPVLTGQVLKLINSAYYSLPNRVASLTRAIIMLGINTVKNLVLATSVLASFKRAKTIQSVPIDDFWAHSLGTGVISKAIAQAQKVPAADLEAYFVAGLMHDLGKLPMIICFPESYDQAIEAARHEQIALCHTEKRVLGFDHSQIGRLIAAKWKFDEAMVQAIVDHHQVPDQKNASLPILDYVGLANLAAYHFNIGSAGEQFLDQRQLVMAAQRCDISFEAVVAMHEGIELEIEKAKVFLQT